MTRWWSSLTSEQRWLVGSVACVWAGWLLYLVSPIDVITDLIPILGWLDDALALLGAVSFTVFAALRLRGTGFGELMPDALRPRSLQAAPPLDSDREPDGDIAGYRPLSADELRSL
jgi:hypothetical protein